jgi:hypothetical protein
MVMQVEPVGPGASTKAQVKISASKAGSSSSELEKKIAI